MKFGFAKKTSCAFILALSVFLFASCKDVVFDSIRKEVKLEDGNISGDIRAIVRFKDCFYIANGGIYYKSQESNFYGAWAPSASPIPTGQTAQVIKLAADSKYLYALVGNTAENQKEGENVGVSRSVYYSEDGSEWHVIESLGTKGSIPYASKQIVYTYIFCTNTIDPANRKAYFVLNDRQIGKTNKAYELNGPNVKELELAPVKPDKSPNAGTMPFSAPTLYSQSCVWFEGEVHFFHSTACTTNETTTKPATMYYYGLGSTLYWDGEKKSETGMVCKQGFKALACTADFLIAGTTAGIKHYVLGANVPGAEAPFSTNAGSTLGSAYIINSVLVTNPELNEMQTPIYASIVYTGNGSSNSAQFDHVGLWAFYPSRGNWNRE